MAILKYIGRRLLVLIPVLLGISLAAFLLGRIAPGDPVDDALFRIGIEFPTEEDRADMRAELGLDRPLPVQYLDWLGDALRGDLGRSYIGNKDIAQEPSGFTCCPPAAWTGGWPPWCCPPWLSPPPTWAPPPASPGATSWPNWGSSTSWWPTPRACPSGR